VLLRVLGLLLVVWLALVVIGFVVKAVLWLAVVGLVLFVLTAGWSWAQQHSRR
jgi:hypothetical protein